MGRNAGVLNGALGLPSLHGVDLHRSPATVRLLAVEPFSKKRQNFGHPNLREQEDRHSSRVFADVRFKEL